MRLKCAMMAATLISWLAGCGGSTSTPIPASVTASHGGLLLALPKQKGFVEIVVEPEKTSKSQGRLVAYFVSSDGSTVLEPAPTDVSFKSDDGKTTALVADAKPDPSSKAARYASVPGAFAPGRALAGDLSANLGGEVASVTVLTR